MSKSKEFSDQTASKLLELFGEENDLAKAINDCEASVRIDSTRAYKLNTVQQQFLEKVPFVSTRSLDPEVIDAVQKDIDDTNDTDPQKRVQNVFDAMKNFVQFSEDGETYNSDGNSAQSNSVSAEVRAKSCLVNAVCVTRHSNVMYYHSSIKEEKGRIKYFPPRFRINVGQVTPNSSVRINTGYTFEMPVMCKVPRVVDGRLVVAPNFSKQPSYIIVPMFIIDKKVKPGDIIPTLFARDAEDRGLLCLTFSTLSGNVGTLTVVLKAYELTSPGANVRVRNQQQGDVQTFKPKDFKNGRTVVNPKVGYYPETMATSSEERHSASTSFATFNKETKIPYTTQRLAIDNVITLLASRKREWNDTAIISTAGVFLPHASNHSVVPKLYMSEERKNNRLTNTHCMAFIKGRCTLFDDGSIKTQTAAATTPNARLDGTNKLINGTMYDLPNYDRLSKSFRQVTRALIALRCGIITCNKLAQKHYKSLNFASEKEAFTKMLTIFDYHHALSDADPRFVEYIKMNDQELFNAKRLSDSVAFSVTLRKGLCMLIAKLFADELSQEQVDRLIINRNEKDLKNNKRCANGVKVYEASDGLEETAAAAASSTTMTTASTSNDIHQDENNEDAPPPIKYRCMENESSLAL